MSVQPAKPALPIKFLFEKLPNVYVFSAHKMFTTICTPFPNRISPSRSWLCLKSTVCAPLNLKELCVSRSLEVGDTFLILSYSKTKGQKYL